MYRFVFAACTAVALVSLTPEDPPCSGCGTEPTTATVLPAPTPDPGAEAPAARAFALWNCSVTAFYGTSSKTFTCPLPKPTKEQSYKCAEAEAEAWCQQQGGDCDSITRITPCPIIDTAAMKATAISKVALDYRMSCVTRKEGKKPVSIGPTRHIAWTNLLALSSKYGGISPGSVKITVVPRFMQRVTGNVVCVGKDVMQIFDIEVSGIDATGTNANVAVAAAQENANRVEEAAAAKGLTRQTSLEQAPVKMNQLEEVVVAVKAVSKDGYTIFVVRRGFSPAKVLENAKVRAEEIAAEYGGVSEAPAEVDVSTVL